MYVRMYVCMYVCMYACMFEVSLFCGNSLSKLSDSRLETLPTYTQHTLNPKPEALFPSYPPPLLYSSLNARY